MQDDIRVYYDVLVRACCEAGKYLKDNLGKIKTIEYKGVSNLVTNVDKGAEQLIVDLIHEHFPAHAILGEESGKSQQESEYKWVIDPLDGTTNFAHGFPFFCVSIGLEYKQEMIAGGIYDPIRDELFSGIKDQGAMLNQEPIHVSDRVDFENCMLATGFSYGVDLRLDNVALFKRFLKDVQAIRRPGAAALDLCYVACGRCDGFWEMGLHPWDTAAGSLIVKESGGVVTNFQGNPYSIYSNEIIAANPHILEKMLDIIKQ